MLAQTAYWATVVGINITDPPSSLALPGVPARGHVHQRGHVVAFLRCPGAIIALYLILSLWLGVTSPPWSNKRGKGPLTNGQVTTSRRGLSRLGTQGMPPTPTIERRRVYQQDKADVKERGSCPPVRMFRGSLLWLLLGSRSSGSTRPARQAARRAGRPGHTINFVPRPDWYFYFLFYLLRIFKWPPTVILGSIGIPTSACCSRCR